MLSDLERFEVEARPNGHFKLKIPNILIFDRYNTLVGVLTAHKSPPDERKIAT